MTATTDTPRFCANHPSIETYLRCNKCEKPICVRCSIPTPVGYRCKECANLRPLPIYQVPPSFFVRAVAAGAGAAALFGVAWAALAFVFGLGLFVLLWTAPFFGFFTGDFISRAVNRKRGAPLVVIGVVSLVVAFALGAFLAPFIQGVLLGARFDFVLARAVALMVGEFLDPFVWVFLALGGFLCASRLR